MELNQVVAANSINSNDKYDIERKTIVNLLHCHNRTGKETEDLNKPKVNYKTKSLKRLNSPNPKLRALSKLSMP